MSWIQINDLTISDIHFGAALNPTERIIAGLDKKLTTKYLKDIQLVKIAGDVFDHGFPSNHPVISLVISWMRRFLSRCARLGIVVIVLEGTPSHDCKQSHLFEGVNNAAEDADKCELYYVKEIEILYIPKLELHVLCIPDEKNTSDEVTLRQVKAMMAARALDKVDIAVMHGFFEFQVPVGRTTRFHSSEEYRALVRYAIWIGHDHTFRMVDNIIVQGSPDRQRHGTEEDKGFVKTTIHRDGTINVTFEVNEHAMDFKTVVVDDNLDVATHQVYSVCDTIRGAGHVRIAANHGHPLLSALDSFKVAYPFIRFTKKVIDEAPAPVSIVDGAEVLEYVPFTIESSNIKTIVHERLPISLYTTAEKEYFDSLMESVI